MCGIVGVLNFDDEPVSASMLAAMSDTMIHRGPDGYGYWREDNVALAHRRLSIIDLSEAGRQPMVSADGRYVLTYNGEVYNFRELRAELEATGITFRSRTDSEVVLYALCQWGEAALTRFNGMFALALWDRQERKLLLARDRYGVKPLYYAISDQRLIFGSEIKAILKHPAVDARMHLPGLLEYFTFQNFFTDGTIFSGIKILPAGCSMTIGENAATAAIRRYWDFCFEEPSNLKSDVDYLEELDFLFKRAVSRQLVSDVDIGAYLSGGMDSGSITAIAAREMPFIRTFTCGFDLSSASGIELNFDERRSAERMSYLFKTEHYEMVLKAGDMERCLPELAWHIEEPRVGQSYPNFYISRLASKFNKVVLAGTGGDEVFGGYPWRYYRAVVNNDFEDYVEKYYGFWHRLIPNRQLQRVFAPVWGQVKDVWTRDIFRGVFDDRIGTPTRPEDYVNHSMYFEAKTFLHGLLVIEDKLSMAHSLETRVPFLDNDLVDFAMRLPARLKLGSLGDVSQINENEALAKYLRKNTDGKLLLRRMMTRHIPSDVANREKQGFSAPDASWFKGESIDYVNRILMENDAAIYTFIDRDAVRDLVKEHLEGRENRRLLIWSLLNVEHACRRFGLA